MQIRLSTRRLAHAAVMATMVALMMVSPLNSRAQSVRHPQSRQTRDLRVNPSQPCSGRRAGRCLGDLQLIDGCPCPRVAGAPAGTTAEQPVA
jgi:hypothetical protein